jgi:hypothetical protein
VLRKGSSNKGKLQPIFLFHIFGEAPDLLNNIAIATFSYLDDNILIQGERRTARKCLLMPYTA